MKGYQHGPAWDDPEGIERLVARVASNPNHFAARFIANPLWREGALRAWAAAVNEPEPVRVAEELDVYKDRLTTRVWYHPIEDEL